LLTVDLALIAAQDQGMHPMWRRILSQARRARSPKNSARCRLDSRALAALCDLGRTRRDVAGQRPARPPLAGVLLPALKPA